MKTDGAIELSTFTTFRIGGRPMRYVMPSGYEELESALRLCRKHKVPWRVLGGGSNLLIEDGTLPFVVIHVCAPGFQWIREVDEHTYRVGAGVRLGKLMSHARRGGHGGLEFLAGIPGTVGGTLAGNAGAWGETICDRVRRLWLVDKLGRIEEVNAGSLERSYRSLDVGGRIITEAEFELEPRAPDLIRQMTRELRRKKASRHPVREKSAGCVFKNPPTCSAGELIDRCGLKGKKCGGAEISKLHANFIVNTGEARASDVLALVEMIKDEVRKKFDVELELELRHWSAQKRAA